MKTQITNQPCQTFVLTVKQMFLPFLLSIVVALSTSAPTFAQDQVQSLEGQFTAIPMQDNTPEQAMQESLAGATLPMWTTNVTASLWGYPYGTYKVQSIGAAPAGNTTTNIPTYIVPLIVKLMNGNNVVATFDPTVPGPACAGGVVPLTATQNSPLFNNSGPFIWGASGKQVNFGTTQYVDAQVRAEWNVTSKWHTLFQYNATFAQPVKVPSTFWGLATTPCGISGAVDFTWFDTYVRTLIPLLSNQGVGPTSLPVFLTYNVVTTPDYGKTLYLGYHSSFSSPLQVYAEAMFDTTGAFKNKAGQVVSEDISDLSHELAETVNDPTITNYAPQWGHVGQVTGCQKTFEVGDPLTGTLYPPITLSGYTYHPQELAMLGWFYDLPSSTGWYSTNGTFTTYNGANCNFGPPIPQPNPINSID